MNENDSPVRPDALLLTLVTMARCAQPSAWEAFVAPQTTGSTVTIYHPRVVPLSIPLDDIADLDELAIEGALEMSRMPSGSRVFTITPKGYQLAYHKR
jgi:hypothetical protein